MLRDSSRVHLGGPFAFYSGLQEDFTPISTYLRFSSTVTKQCITISISDDTLTEFPEEFFSVALERAENTPDRVLLTCNKADIIIIDNDGNHKV